MSVASAFIKARIAKRNLKMSTIVLYPKGILEIT